MNLYDPVLSSPGAALHRRGLRLDGGKGGDGQLGQDSDKNVGDDSGNQSKMENLGAINLGTVDGERLKAIDVSAGSEHSCAVLENGEVKCWGKGGDGRLGQDSDENVGDGSEVDMDELDAIDLGTVDPVTGDDSSILSSNNNKNYHPH